ncbi:hypothetical protein C5B85_04370 [Pseudoclavibacter sp. AY1F1]|uniref:hypothetical protein n=1 Tax=Pseudoclavibacter sp. AY1F1 TaxID=2080583 RepID=UPI000CE8D303|nr:hypothetical protein [Pseudoclavibacter sp. AY1F1]PPF45906.1 hypothetical protein C5B85_04370 [Pseudoclavibacter sp. AY1F1]
MSYSKLLRWYPKAWRGENGDVFLGMLEDDAAARGATKPEFTEAWSIRVHGLAERASYKIALALALVAVVSFSGPAVVGLLQRLTTGETFMSITPALFIAVLIGRAAGVAAFGFAVVTLLVRALQMSAWPATLSAAAFALSALTGSAEFAFWLLPVPGAEEELLFPLNFTWPASTALFMVAATIAAGSALSEMFPTWLRLVLGGALGILSGIVYSNVMLGASGVNSLVACTLVVAVVVAASVTRSQREGTTRAVAGVASRDLALLAATAVSSGAIGCIGLVIQRFNLAGAELWSSSALVLAVLAPLPTFIAGAALVRRRMGSVAIWAAFSWCLALVLVAACWTIRPFMEGFLFMVAPVLAAALALFGTGLCLAAIRGLQVWAIPAAAALAIAGGFLLGGAILKLAIIAPFLCLGAAALAFGLVRVRARSKSLRPVPVGPDVRM